MLLLANLLNVLSTLIDRLDQKNVNLSSLYGPNTQKTTVYLQMVIGRHGNDALSKREVYLNEHLRSIHLALYYFSKNQTLKISEVNLRFYWTIRCGQFNYIYSIPVKRTEKTLVADIDQRDFGPAWFQIYNKSVGHSTILYFSISITVSADIIGAHAFRLTDREGNTVLGSAKIFLKVPVCSNNPLFN